MSHQAFVDYHDNYLNSSDGAALKAKVDAMSDADEYCSSIAAAGKASGYDFDAEDVRMVMRASESQMAKEIAESRGELSDDQLEDVAGGAGGAMQFASVPTIKIQAMPPFMDKDKMMGAAGRGTVMCPW